MSSLNEKIINSVRERPVLWKPDQARKFPAQALQAWENFCTEIGRPVTDRDEVKKMWSDLRAKYSRARKTATKKRPSGTAAKKRKTRFLFYEEMSFLADVIDVPK